MKINPLVSIVIVNWNGGDVFLSCLKSLKGIKYPNWELIVVDNGSIDGSEMYPKRIGLSYKLIKNRYNKGFANANNQALEVVKGKYLLLLNNDTLVTKSFLNLMVKRIDKDNTIGAIQPKIFMMDKRNYLDNIGSFMTKIGFLQHYGFNEKDTGEYNHERLIFSAKGACLLIRRKSIDKVGFFDPDFFSYFEESDFCWRLWLRGYKVIFYPDAYIYHKVGFTIKRLDVGELNFHYSKNRICSLIKNLEFKNLIGILGLHLIISFGIALVFFARLRIRNSLIIIRAFFWNLKHLGETLEKRRMIQRNRSVSDENLFSHLMVPINIGKYFNDFRRIQKDLE